ncbi:hypothetical protein JHK87_004570 [Glycine soja]|nr:hypothetical protein JHK87_004570 [Glycine soja]
MARSPNKIKNIDGSKETLKLAVRITDLWFIGTPNKSEQAEMVFVDSDPAIAILHFVGQLLLAFLKFLDDHEGHSPITVLLTHGRIKEVQGSYPPSVNNSFKASKLVINQPVMEIQEFNERFAELGIEAWSFFKSHGEGSSQLSGSIQLSSKESFFGKAEAKTIVEINTISEDGDVDLNASPEALDKLLGYVLAFKIKVQPKFRNSVVLKCSTDSSLINVVMDILVDVEQSMSVTADHDPLLGLPLTPTKRQTFQDCDDEAESSQILPAQLSSNKLKKHDAI